MLVTVSPGRCLAGCIAARRRHPAIRRAALGVTRVASPPQRRRVSPDVTLAFAGDVTLPVARPRLLKHPAAAFGSISSVLGFRRLTRT